MVRGSGGGDVTSSWLAQDEQARMLGLIDGVAEKPILLPGPDNLIRSPGWIRRQTGNLVNGLLFADRHRDPKSHRSSRARYGRGRTPKWSSSPVGMPAGPHPPRYRASDRRSFGSPASFSNSA